MGKYNPVTEDVLKELRSAIGDLNVQNSPDVLDKYKTDEERNEKYIRLPEVVVFPETTEQVAAIVRIANKYLVPVTPRGAGTSTIGQAIPSYGGILLTMERMNKILELNAEALYAVVEGGCGTINLQNEAKRHGVIYAGDVTSSESSFIGGNIATNAGSLKAVKYGTTRQQVHAVEVVTPTGEIVNLGARLLKNSTGYALDQLIIGSEGTLGIITKATMRLRPWLRNELSVLAIFDDYDKAIATPNILLKAGLQALSMEFMDNKTVKGCQDYQKVTLPYADKGCHWVIVSIDGHTEEEVTEKAEKLNALLDEGGAIDVLVADDLIWKARKEVTEATREKSLVFHTEDNVVPIDKLALVFKKTNELLDKHGISGWILAHIGDGNVHVNKMKYDTPDAEWDDKLTKFTDELGPFIYQLGGKLSGEHGIGPTKIDMMAKLTDPVELKMMTDIKRALDPNWILNPGKIFAVPS